MSGISIGQENLILDQLNGRQMPHKLQTSAQISEMNRNVKKALKTPKSHGFKTSSDKSSRKAFGNVSNVLNSGTQHPIGTKHQIQMKASTKGSEQSNMKSNQKKSLTTEVETDSNSKYLDDIEDMYPMNEQMMADMREPITHQLFGIDEQLVLQMEFDSDLTETLLPNKQSFDLNFL